MAFPIVSLIKTIYLYLVAFVALIVMIVFPMANTINAVLKTYIFTKADIEYYAEPMQCELPEKLQATASTGTEKTEPEDKCAQTEAKNKEQAQERRTAELQRNLARDISFLIVGIPLFFIHWRIIRKRKEQA
ncbi:MAG: hypothetical protein ABIH87_00755 [bacterium]